jgi:hypothetical protein
MSTSLATSWLFLEENLQSIWSRGAGFKKKDLANTAEALPDWYGEFTTLDSVLMKEALADGRTRLHKQKKPVEKSLHTAVRSALQFIFAYLEPVETVNARRYDSLTVSNKKTVQSIERILERMSKFHTERFASLRWITNWVLMMDPLFPPSMVNKIDCCLSTGHKPCNDRPRCFFDPPIEWIRTSAMSFSRHRNSDDCCQGSTLSSCSGGTLSCDCVAGNTGCDCKAPNKLCPQNKKVMAELNGFGGSEEGIPCLILDPIPGQVNSNMPYQHQPPKCLVLDLARGRFQMPSSAGYIDLLQYEFTKNGKKI